MKIKTINSKDVKAFVVTGRIYNSNIRFSNKYSNYSHAMSINLWNGSVWAELHIGKRKLLKRVTN